MARLGCICGADMTNVVSPSRNRLNIYYLSEVQHAIETNPQIRLWDFYTGWDEKNDCENSFQERSESVEYWYCNICGRIYEVQAISCGKRIRTYAPVMEDVIENLSTNKMKEIIPLTDIMMNGLLETNDELLLADYVADIQDNRYFISETEDTVYLQKAENNLQVIYKNEIH